VEDAEHDVDGDERGQDEDGLIGQRVLKRLGRALEARPNGGRQADVTFGTLDGGHRVAERDARGQIERERDRREEALMVHGQRGRAGREMGDGAERDLGPRGRLHVDGIERLGVLLELGATSSTTWYW